MFKPKTTINGRLENSSGARGFEPGPLGYEQNPESVPFVRRVLQNSRPDECWFTLTRHAEVVDRYSYSSSFKHMYQILLRMTRFCLFAGLTTKANKCLRVFTTMWVLLPRLRLTLPYPVFPLSRLGLQGTTIKNGRAGLGGSPLGQTQ